MPAIEAASSLAAWRAMRTARASMRSTTIKPSPNAKAPTISASAKNTCMRIDMPRVRVRSRRDTTNATNKIRPMAAAATITSRSEALASLNATPRDGRGSW
jgi:hypothetical protein